MGEFDNISPSGDWEVEEPLTEKKAGSYDQAITSKRRSKKREWAPGDYRPNCRKRLKLPKWFVEREPDVGPRKKLSEL